MFSNQFLRGVQLALLNVSEKNDVTSVMDYVINDE